MKIAAAADHAGYQLKDSLVAELKSRGHDVEDLGTHGPESVDYPDFAGRVAAAVASGQAERGLLVCGTGIGMSIAANRVRGVRAAVVTQQFQIRYARLHNDANVLCIGARVTAEAAALEILEHFLDTAYEGGRHQRRVDMFDAMTTTDA